MKQTELIMGMPITVEIVDTNVTPLIFNDVFTYFRVIDEQFSTYKPTSEISKINRQELLPAAYSPEMKEVLALAEKTKQETHGYFDISYKGMLDPSGIVKGWAIQKAAQIIQKARYTHYCVEAGGDIQVHGTNAQSLPWSVGIRNPFDVSQIVKVVYLTTEAIATSGSYERGNHIYNPLSSTEEILEIKSISIIGPTIVDADRFATAAFAMGKKGIQFIQTLAGFEGYMIDAQGISTQTIGFSRYAKHIS